MKYYKLNLRKISEQESFADASKEELRVLISLISRGGEIKDADELALLSRTSRARVISSIAFWEDSGIIFEASQPDNQNALITEEYENDEDPEKSAAEVARSIKNRGLASLLSEIARLMDRPMLSRALAAASAFLR